MKHNWLRYGVFAILASGTLLAAAGAIAQVKLTPFRSEITFNFQNERASQSRSIRLDLSESSSTTPTAVVLGGFISTTGPFVVPAEDVKTSVTIDSASETVELDVSVDPSIDPWKAGEFTSSIRVAGEGYDSATIPVKLTFRSGSPALGTVVALAVLAVGVVVGLLFKASGTPAVTRQSAQRRGVIKWAVLLTGIVTGVVVVIFGFDTQYLNNDTFGAGGFSDWLALFAWGFAAGFSGKTISELTSQRATP